MFPVVTGVAPLPPERERALRPKESFRECETCPEMIVVPAGSFTMGSPADEKERQEDEQPQHLVGFTRPFAVGKFAVTLDQFAAFVKETGHDTGSECYTYEGNEWKVRSERSWRNPGSSPSGSHPAVCISWDDAKAYVVWLSRKTGKGYRLLSEAEREYVTRAGTTTPFWWGSTISISQANYDGNETYAGGSKGEWRKKSMPVESFQPNPWGLYQVHGNVWEWVEDCYGINYEGVPTDGSVAWADSDSKCKVRVLRGGAWDLGPNVLRSAKRSFWYPNAGRLNTAGFRVARPLLTP